MFQFCTKNCLIMKKERKQMFISMSRVNVKNIISAGEINVELRISINRTD